MHLAVVHLFVCLYICLSVTFFSNPYRVANGTQIFIKPSPNVKFGHLNWLKMLLSVHLPVGMHTAQRVKTCTLFLATFFISFLIFLCLSFLNIKNRVTFSLGINVTQLFFWHFFRFIMKVLQSGKKVKKCEKSTFFHTRWAKYLA